MTETGYDLAVLTRPAGEARFANVRKMARLAAEFEQREGRDLRGLLDFLAARAEGDAEAQAATAAEGHDGVRIMTVHNAKGLEFGVVAVPDLARRLLNGNRSPLLAIGREEQPRVGLRLVRLGSPKIDLYDYGALCEEAQEREAEEELRLFHVAATRAREHLILSGVVNPKEGRETKGRAVVERLVEALGVPRDEESTRAGCGAGAAAGPGGRVRALGDPGAGQPPLARAGRRAAASCAAKAPASAGSARARRRWSSASRRSSPAAPSPTPRSPPTRNAPTASTWSGCWGWRGASRGRRSEGEPSAREERTARGAAVHALLEWSQANDWAEPARSWSAVTPRPMDFDESR